MAGISGRKTNRSLDRAKRGAHRPAKGGKKKQTLFDLIGQTGPESDFDFEAPRLGVDMGLGIPGFSENRISRRQAVSVTKLSSREFNQDVGKAKRAAEGGPVIITDRGRLAFVLLKYEDYRRLLGKRPRLSQLLNDEATKDLEFEPARMQDKWLRPADFD